METNRIKHIQTEKIKTIELNNSKPIKTGRLTKDQSYNPRVLFSLAVETSHRSILVGELAKIMQQNGVNTGQNRLFQWLRENNYLCKSGERYNRPTQRAMNLGLFELKKTTITKPDGTILVVTTPKITGKGQIYFLNKFVTAS